MHVVLMICLGGPCVNESSRGVVQRVICGLSTELHCAILGNGCLFWSPPFQARNIVSAATVDREIAHNPDKTQDKYYAQLGPLSGRVTCILVPVRETTQGLFAFIVLLLPKQAAAVDKPNIRIYNPSPAASELRHDVGVPRSYCILTTECEVRLKANARKLTQIPRKVMKITENIGPNWGQIGGNTGILPKEAFPNALCTPCRLHHFHDVFGQRFPLGSGNPLVYLQWDLPLVSRAIPKRSW
ncbi:hypothetical protein B0H13DRAFT_1936508 [Mycena leptocephala]|nr:hypothetical protein B0H13DRAFT_1936508 [Mycena leptocephala]